jgi:hypothetical protein
MHRAIALAFVFLLGSINVFVSPDHSKSRHTVTFLSKLTDDKKGYNLVLTTFKPTKFKLTINGTKLRDGQSLNIDVENNKFLIRYDYEFKAMFQTFAGYREVEFEIDPERNHYEIDFSWKHEHRFIIKHAKFIRITKIHEPGSEHAR